jgi:predicted ATPase
MEKPVLKIVGTDGEAFALLGKARRVAIQNKMDWDKISAEATSGDYDHLLQTLDKYFEVE